MEGRGGPEVNEVDDVGEGLWAAGVGDLARDLPDAHQVELPVDDVVGQVHVLAPIRHVQLEASPPTQARLSHLFGNAPRIIPL